MKKINLLWIGEQTKTKSMGEALRKTVQPIDEVLFAATHEDALSKLNAFENIHVILTTHNNEEYMQAYRACLPEGKILFLAKQTNQPLKTNADAVIHMPCTATTFVKTLEALIEKEERIERVIDQQYKALSDATRRKILDALQDKTLTAGELAALCQTTKPNISQHLKVLKNSGLVQEEKKGLYVFYSLSRFDFQQAKKEVGQVLNIKEKILYDMQQIAYKKNCEPVVGATDSQDDGTLYIMKDSETLISFHYSFRLSSFSINFEIPTYLQKGGSFRIRYEDTKAIEDLYEKITEELHTHCMQEEKKKETSEKARDELKKYMYEKTRNRHVFMTKDEEKLTQLHAWAKEFLAFHYTGLLPEEKMKAIEEALIHDIISLGKIQPLMDDPNIEQIMINAPNGVWIVRNGQPKKTAIQFNDYDELTQLARKIATHAGSRIDRDNPVLITVLPDGSRVHMILPPVSVHGIVMVIKRLQKRWTMDELLRVSAINPEMAQFLEAAVRAKSNIIVSGHVGGGKTSMLNVLSDEIPEKERIVTIEEETELTLIQNHVVELKTRMAESKEIKEVTLRDCIKNAHNLAADRMIVSEIYNGAVFAFIQAYNTGHDGSMTTINAHTPQDALGRMQDLAMYERLDYPPNAIKQTIAQAVELLVHVARMKDGTRKITEITQVVGYDNDQQRIITQPLFKWVLDEKENDESTGQFIYTRHPLSKKLVKKFTRYNVANPLEQLALEHPKEVAEKMEEEVPLFLLDIAEAVAVGYSFQNIFAILRDIHATPLTNEFAKVQEEMSAGLSIEQTLLNRKKVLQSTQIDLLVDALLLNMEVGMSIEEPLHTIHDLLEERNRFISTFSRHQKNAFFESKEWMLLHFVELLSCAPSSNGFVNNLERVSQCQENIVTKEFKLAVEAMKQGKDAQDALKEAAHRLDMEEAVFMISRMNQALVFGSDMRTALKNQLPVLYKMAADKTY